MSDAAPGDVEHQGDDDAAGSPFGPEPVPNITAETPPDAKPRRRAAPKLRRMLVGDDDTTPAPAVERTARTTPGEKPPRTRPASSGRREPLAPVFAMLYGGIGTMLGHAGAPELIPTARVLQFNAPVAGRAFDELIKDTVLDRLAQPLAKRGDKLQAVGNALGLPLIIYALTTRPELWPTLEPIAREMFYANLVEMAPVIQERKKRDREMAKVIKELADEGLIGPGEDGTTPDADALFRSIFQPPEPAPAPPET